MLDRRGLLEIGAIGSAATWATMQKSEPAPSEHSAETVDVRKYGAVGDGIADDTAAFNRACRAQAPWSPHLRRAIHVPAGVYRLDGTIFVRKGQSLIGEGHATKIDATRATGPTFALGRRAGSGDGEPDPGGAPVRLSSLHGWGGSPSHGFVLCDAQGFTISSLFLTAVGIGIELGTERTVASDGIIKEVIVDQCLHGLSFINAQNVMVNCIQVYKPRFAITIGDKVHDLILSDLIISYAEQVALTIQGEVANIVVSNLMMVANAQYDQFVANVLLRITSGDVLFTGCTFRNWPGACIVQDLPGGMTVTFVGCIFDGSRSAEDYDWSRNAEVYNASTLGAASFRNCSFRHLQGPVARLPAGSASLELTGGAVQKCLHQRIQSAAGFTGQVRIQAVENFPEVRSNLGCVSAILPVWARDTFWKLTVVRAADGFAEEIVVKVSGRSVERLSGWCTTDESLLRCSVKQDADMRTLWVTIATHDPAEVTFAADTIG